MQENERQLIDKLFGQLREAAAQTTNRDSEADRYIRQLVQQQPELLYNMVQTLILQQKALQNAKAQVDFYNKKKERNKPRRLLSRENHHKAQVSLPARPKQPWALPGGFSWPTQ